MHRLLVEAARSLEVPESQRALWGPFFDALVAAVETGSEGRFLEAVEAQSRLSGREGDRSLSEVFALLQEGLQALREAVLAKQPDDQGQAAVDLLLEVEGQAVVRAGVGYAEGLEERVDDLAEEVEALRPHDALTGAMKLPHVQNQLVLEIDRCRRMNLSLGIAALVIQGLRELADERGRDAAERELGRVGRLLRESLRGYDSVGRLSDHEFILDLPDVSRAGLAGAMERLRRALDTGEERPPGVDYLFVLLHLEMVDMTPAEIVAAIRRGVTEVASGERYVVWL